MPGYQSSKQIFSKSQNNLKKLETTNKDIKETAASLSEEEDKNSNRNSLRNVAVSEADTFSSSLQQTANLVDGMKSSLVGLQSALQNVSSASTAMNSLLATNLISLTQINSVISAFRADYLLAKSGNSLTGDGYYDVGLIVSSLSGIKSSNREIDKILKNIRKAANYANKASNVVRSKLGNKNMAKDDGEGGLLDKLLGLAQQGQQYAGLATLLPGKAGKAASKFAGADTSSIGGLLEGLMSNEQKKKILNPLKEMGMDFEDSNNPFKQMLGGLMGKMGLSKSKKEREKDPNLVMSSLAPFADDIKDMVEFKVKAVHALPKAIPEYATAVWIVNSSDQTDYVKNKGGTRGKDLDKKRLQELLEGVANNTKDKYGRDLLKMEYDDDGNVTSYGGRAARGFNQGEIKRMDQQAQNRIFQINHESSGLNTGFTDALQNFSDFSDGTLVQTLGTTAGGILSNVLGGHKGGKRGRLPYRSEIKGSHKGGKRGKNKRKNKIYNVQVHHDERILGPNALANQKDLDSTVEVLGGMVGMLSSAVSLQQLKNQLFMKFANKEKVTSSELKIEKGIIGAEAAKPLDGLKGAKEFAKIAEETKSKLFNKKNEKMTTSEYFGIENNPIDEIKNKIQGTKEKLFGLIDSKLFGSKDKDEKKDENSEAEVSDHQEQVDQETEDKKQEIDEQSQAEVSEHQDEMNQETEDKKQEIDEQSQAEVSEHQAQVQEDEEKQKQDIEAQSEANVESHRQEIQAKEEADKKAMDDEYEEKKKLREGFEKKKGLIEKANKAKAWAIEKAGNVAARAKKMAELVKNFAIDKAARAKDLAIRGARNLKRIAVRAAGTVKRLAKKLGNKVKNAITHANAKILIERAKAIKIALLEKINSAVEMVKSMMEGAATVAEAPIEASKAIPVVGPGVAIAAGIGVTAALTAVGIAAMKAAKKGKEGKVDAAKAGKDAEKATKKAKDKAEKDEDKKKKEEDKDKEKDTKKSEGQENKEAKEDAKVQSDLDKVETNDERKESPSGLNEKREEDKENKEENAENKEEAKEEDQGIKDAEEAKNQLNEGSSASPSNDQTKEGQANSEAKPQEGNAVAEGADVNTGEGLLKYLNKKQIKALAEGAKSKFATMMLKDPKKAANIIFMLNNGPSLLQLKATKGSDLNNVEKATTEATASVEDNDTLNENSSSNTKGGIWGKLLNKLNKKDFLSDDIGDEGYSENVDVALMQNAQTKEGARTFNAFAKSLGMAVMSDNDNNALFTTTIRKNAQDEALRKNLNAAGNAQTSTASASSPTSSGETNTASSSSTLKFDGSRRIAYNEDKSWNTFSNGTTKKDIDNSPYFTETNSSETLIRRIVNNNWKYYKKQNDISDDTTLIPDQAGKNDIRDFWNSEFNDLNTSLIKNINFGNKEAREYMWEKIGKSYGSSEPWTKPNVMNKNKQAKKDIRDYVQQKLNVDISKYGLGRNRGFFGKSKDDKDFLNASEFALSRGYKETDGGTYPRFFRDYLKKDGINVTNEMDNNSIKRRLLNGNPVILMGKDSKEDGTTPYGASPHYVVATGYDGKNIKVIDSESKNDYDIYDANKTLSHSSIKMSTNKRTYSSSPVKAGGSKSYSSQRRIAGGSTSYSSSPLSITHRSYSSSPVKAGGSKSYSSARQTYKNKNYMSSPKMRYQRFGKGRYGRGFSNEENVKKFWAYALGAGMSDAYIAGIAGNIDAESGFDPLIIEGGGHSSTVPYSSGGYGLIQWTGSTFQKTSDEFIKKYSNYGGLNTLEGQIFWIIECATMSERAASFGDGSLDYDVRCLKEYGTLAELNAKTPEELAVIWHEGVERSKYGSGDRSSRARKYYDAFAGKITPSKDMAGGGTVYSKTCWSGDSRTEQMHNYFPDLEAYATKGGQTIDYFNQHYSEISDKVGYNIFCWYGVNGATTAGAKKTAEAYNKLAADLKGKSQVFAGTIGHCPNGTGSGKVEGGAGQSVDKQNEAVVEFNDELKKNLSSDVKIIDTYTFIKGLESTMGADKMTTDNLHYTKECSQKIREYVEQQIKAAGGTVGTATAAVGNSVQGVNIGDLYVTLQGYVDGYDELSKYKKGPDIWDGVSSNSKDLDTTTSTATPSANYSTTSNTPTSTPTPSSTPTVPNTSSQTTTPSTTPTPSNDKEIEKEVESQTPGSSVVQPEVDTKVYQKNGTMYIVNNIEYGVKTNIEAIIDEFNELNHIQDDSLDVLNVIYEKLLKRKGKNPNNNRIQGYDYLLQKRRFT